MLVVLCYRGGGLGGTCGVGRGCEVQKLISSGVSFVLLLLFIGGVCCKTEGWSLADYISFSFLSEAAVWNGMGEGRKECIWYWCWWAWQQECCATPTILQDLSFRSK
jgi:hypothetical protein